MVKPIGRVGLFWALVLGTCLGLHWLFPLPAEADFWATTARALHGDVEAVGTRAYAFALAFGLGALAAGFAVAFLVLHVLVLRLTLSGLRRRVEAAGDRAGFSAGYAAARAALEKSPLIGHAWAEFDKALVHRPGEPVIRSTARPQAYFNLALAREKYFGLKMMGALPGYFVGLGLLLTFAGLVLALNKAAAAVNSADAAAMQGATRDLLQVATFKFATSIAGLAASLSLSLLFRVYTILMEEAFTAFCEAVERRVRYLSPQQIAAESRDLAARQVEELQAINSADFLARVGASVAPGVSAGLEAALERVMTPLTASVGQALHSLSDGSRAGMSDMVSQFSQSLQHGAGSEMRALAGTLREMQEAITRLQQGLTGSGADFGRRMTEAAENLNRLVGDAGARLGEGSDQTRAALMEAVAALRETFDQANRKIDESLGSAAGGAAARLEQSMGRVLGGLEGQVAGFGALLSGFQDRIAGQIDETRARAAAAQVEATEAVSQASTAAAHALQDGLADALAQIRGEVDRFVTALKTGEATLSAQAGAMRGAADSARQVAEAFDRTVREAREASAPLAQSGARIADATAALGEAAGRSVALLGASQEEARRLALALGDQVETVERVWRGHAARFEAVDEALGRAFERLSQGTDEQHERLAGFARDMDTNFAKAVETLTACIGQLKENGEDMASAVEELGDILRPRAAE
ncbi:anti-phage ZorAB system protein ZorA [Xanthobacter sp. V4C-4]|uniref:anti-phage ZorAB system protein ZorA n=1 Tax=Xanthobacter cornucopiae TaxID=3119924 RepID=UPI00372CC253